MANKNVFNENKSIYCSSLKLPGSKSVSLGILDVANVEGSGMTFAAHNGADTSQIPSASDHAQVS